jgi:hypothetical protein
MMLARVKQDYLAGPVIAFSGREYVRSEWREVPAGFEDQAQNHPLLETQPSFEEIRAESPMAPGLGNPEPAVTAVTAESAPAEPPTEEPQTDIPEGNSVPTETPTAEEPPAEEVEPRPSRRRGKRTED